MFLVLEGADGTGKSTLVTRIADKVGGVAYATPPKKYQKYSEKLHRDASADEHYAFYRNAIQDASEEVSELVRSGKPVICDRYWISTLTYHQVMGATVTDDDFATILKPDLTVLLVADADTQIQRIVARGMDAGDKRVLDKQFDLTQALFRNLVLEKQPFISLDTKSFSVEQCTEMVVKIAF